LNTITIELCAEDRARLDAIIEGLKEGIRPVISTPETPKEEPQVNTYPEEETPTEAEIEAPQPVQEEEVTAADHPVEDTTPFPEPKVTLEQIQQKVIQLAARGGDVKAKVREVINTYGTKVSDLKDYPEKWTEVWEKLNALEG
jgi:hypothetical protein